MILGSLRLAFVSSALIFTVSPLFSEAIAKGRYGLAPSKELKKIQPWVSARAGRYWIQGEKQVFYFDPEEKLGLSPFGKGFWQPMKGQPYFLFGSEQLPTESRELLRGGRVRLIETNQAQAMTVLEHGTIKPIVKNHSLVESLSTPLPNLSPKEPISFEVGQRIDGEKWRKDVETLSGWNRYSYGSGIDLAQAWLEENFAAIPGIAVSEFPFAMSGGTGVNVIARLEGASRPDDVYIVGAHYDSTSEKPSVLAPGAEDNATGAAGLLALARVFAEQRPEATILFVGFSGEEQGLYGSKAWLKDWIKRGEQKNIKAILIMDMIGYSGDEELDLLLETSTLTKPLLAAIESAQTDKELVVSKSFDYWGSDHEPFLDNNIPAILFIENDYLTYPSYHKSSDTIERVHPTLGPKILTLMANSLSLWVY